MTPSQIAEISRRHLADYDAHRTATAFENPSFALTIAEAYAVQTQVAQFRAARGEAIAGYKIGCFSEPVQAQLGVDRPVFGHIFASELHHSGAVLDPARFDHLAIEGEFAVRIAEDIPEPGWLFENPDRGIASLFLVIELHNNHLRGAGPRAAELIANNALHAGVVLPAIEDPLGDPQRVITQPISVFRSEQLLGATTARAIPGGPITSVLKVANYLASAGTMLRRGDIVLTGSPLPLYPVCPGDRIVVCGGPRTAVEVTIGAGGR